MTTIDYTNWVDVQLGLEPVGTKWDLSERLQLFLFRENAFPFNYRNERKYMKYMSHEACRIMDGGPMYDTSPSLSVDTAPLEIMVSRDCTDVSFAENIDYHFDCDKTYLVPEMTMADVTDAVGTEGVSPSDDIPF